MTKPNPSYENIDSVSSQKSRQHLNLYLKNNLDILGIMLILKMASISFKIR